MSAETQLVEVPAKETALQVYSAANGLDPFLAKIREEIDGFVPDVTTRKGREAIASIAYKVARSKTALDNVGKELVAELKEVPKKIDAERKRMRDLLDSWQAEVRRPLTEWEEAEAARVAKHEAGIAQIRAWAEASVIEEMSAFYLADRIVKAESVVVDATWEEFEAEAHRAKAASLEGLRSAFAKREQYEAEQAEMERLRAEAAAREQKEREERIAREAAEQARRQEEAKAQAERDAAVRREAEAQAAAERRELELKLAAERAEREKVEAQRRAEQAERDAQARAEAAAAAERQRQADEQARIEREAAAREADKAHKKAINNEALAALIAGGMPEECAKQAITLIAQRKVPHITINY
ncbi:hypothetical protein [Pseudomonas aeruginosa]|uniref:hypothetical protein n=1 Tax=Pseudomonas aeruginosa TaxID=287 RepID=UPI000EB03045|nr:hypothetical protein [Pseudomonas aeruginosa]MBG5799764.1 hypothetical protein [Pseudomonas aeruginosa]MBP8321312.1 hypothetical protein [Pseudomonas aeruginosa]MBP8351293.1 hypothetical protein [Pseudomonas aeruginosa]RTU93138.1 hypothetical protein DY983_24720 [Pseudomonas aeruginosa]